MYTWSKNFAKKMPKRAILAVEWNFERGLINRTTEKRVLMNMKIDRVKFDRICDYVPGVSIANNGVDLIQQRVFKKRIKD